MKLLMQEEYVDRDFEKFANFRHLHSRISEFRKV